MSGKRSAVQGPHACANMKALRQFNTAIAKLTEENENLRRVLSRYLDRENKVQKLIAAIKEIMDLEDVVQ